MGLMCTPWTVAGAVTAVAAGVAGVVLMGGGSPPADEFTTQEAADGYMESGLVQVMSKAFVVLAKARFPPLSGLRVLDFGSGAGFNGLALLRGGAKHVTLADTSGTMLDRAKSLIRKDETLDGGAVTIMTIGFNPTELKLPQVDVTLAAFVLHYVPVADQPACVRALANSLAPGGKLLVADIPVLPFGLGPGSQVLRVLEAEPLLRVDKSAWHWNRVPWSSIECTRV